MNMLTQQYVQLMAAYSGWQNQNIVGAADTLTDAERREDRGAFFGSIHRTLNHLLWGDQLWLHRLAGASEPKSTDIEQSTDLYEDWAELKAERFRTDELAIDWARNAAITAFEGQLSWYSGAVGKEVTRPKWALIVQLFNHGTHHRGQMHAMLTGAGVKPGDTDVQFMESDAFPW